VRLLIDTHVLLWALAQPDRISDPTRRRIEDPNNVVLVSAVSAWEIEIKRALGKLDAPGDLPEQMRRARFGELPMHVRHVQTLRALPALHRDPFDRMLIAQAMTDDLVLITNDDHIRAYACKTLPC
jgi:PIN domain nuclease of toxin-antitoxin system